MIRYSTKMKVGVTSVLSAVLATSVFLSGLPTPVAKVSAATTTYAATTIAINPGANESQLNFTWYTPTGSSSTSVVQFVPASLVVDGVFPDNAPTFTGAATAASTGYLSNKVTVTGLVPSTAYKYRVGDGTAENWSAVYDFQTQRNDTLDIMFVGDPQIGASGNADSDTVGWTNTLNTAIAKFPNFNFIMSAGDQVNTSTSESQYTQFESPSVLRSIPVATTVGNHDTSANYQYHFNVPNLSTKGTTTGAGGDYYYTYGDTLFMVLNSNSANYAEHNAFMEETVAKVPNARWRIVTFHHSIYSTASHAVDNDVLNLRAGIVQKLDSLKIDMVFMGHDHVYVRTKNMKNNAAVTNQTKDEQGRVVNPDGITYTTANSASGSKYYQFTTGYTDFYSEVKLQLNTPTYSTIHIDQGSLTINTYKTNDNTFTPVDTYSMVKTGMNAIEVIPPTKQNYEPGEAASLDLTGLAVNKINLDGSKAPIDPSQVTVTGFDPAVKGTQTITVTYNIYGVKYTGTFSVSVADPVPVFKLYSKQGTVVKEDNNTAEFYLAVSNAKKLNAIDASFTFDSTKFELKSAVALVDADKVIDTSITGNTLRVMAGFPLSVTSSPFVDLVKITLVPLDANTNNVQATLSLDSATSTLADVNEGVDALKDGDNASISIRSLADLSDIKRDGKLNVEDLSLALQYYRATPQDTNWNDALNADINFDNIVDLTDFTVIIKQILKSAQHP